VVECQRKREKVSGFKQERERESWNEAVERKISVLFVHIVYSYIGVVHHYIRSHLEIIIYEV
jgi:hypothetical protein